MDKMKNNRWIKWLLIILGVLILAIVAFFVVRALVGDGSSYKEYDTQETADGIAVRLNSVERLPMTSEKCQERVTVLTSSDDRYDCVIANVTITNNTDKDYDYSYRNFGYRSPRSDKLLGTAITLTSFKGVDITKDLKPGESHTQEVHYTLQKTVNLSDLRIVYQVDPRADDGGREILLQL